MKDSPYYNQAKLLLRILPIIERYPLFALKGGTAINFFIRDLPRLSVDIDLTYIIIDERRTALAAIGSALRDIGKDIERLIPSSVVKPKITQGSITGLFIQTNTAIVKIEPNLVLRGTIYEPTLMRATPRVQKELEISVEARVLDISELYGGKICAALDRQHPRDLFDVKLLLDNEGLTDKIRKSFIVHLISHSRPMAELLNPHFQDIKTIFENEFSGMTFVDISLPDLEQARAGLVQKIHKGLTDEEKTFIISVKNGEPQWDLLGIKGVDLLPAVQWKLFNIAKIDKKKLRLALSKLEKSLQL